MAMIGSIEKFNPKESDITSYLERLEQLFICNAVEADKKVAMLLTLLGGEAYNVLKDLLAPDLPSTRTYVELKKVLSDHYSPKRLIIAERYKFYNAIQEGNEDIKMFVAKLKNLSQYCSFGQFLSECLRDRLVCGVRSYAIKRKLLSEDNLTFESAYKTALAMELAEGQIKSMGGENNVLSVAEELDKLFVKKKVFKNESKSSQSKEGGTQWRPCFRCLRKHDPNNCPAKGWECFKCKKKGHTSRVCKSPNVNAVEEVEGEESSQDDSLVLGFLSVLGSMKEDAEKAVLDLEGRKICFEIDTGACRTVMHIDDFNKYLSNLTLYNVKYDLRVLTGQEVSIIGETDVVVNHNKVLLSLPLVVLKSKYKFAPLIGRNWLKSLSPNWRGHINFSKKTESNDIQQVSQWQSEQVGRDVSCEKSIQKKKIESLVQKEEQVVAQLTLNIKNDFKSVFLDQPESYINKFKIELKLKEGAQPIFVRAYDMPYALKDKVEIELIKMVNSGILRKENFSNWASPMWLFQKRIQASYAFVWILKKH
uniref:CCHC-type domain-containing protein n=1 Tax=Anoplophora glabripennis TaxID=217634 RepID=V5I8X4_ANOGL